MVIIHFLLSLPLYLSIYLSISISIYLSLSLSLSLSSPSLSFFMSLSLGLSKFQALFPSPACSPRLCISLQLSSSILASALKHDQNSIIRLSRMPCIRESLNRSSESTCLLRCSSPMDTPRRPRPTPGRSHPGTVRDRRRRCRRSSRQKILMSQSFKVSINTKVP